mmetsp:Transcript_16030/g.34739  ORF Transcript_16030/g.34739 Transcript_16030/m.34739 type:complete len:247 (+) Transcript_16030:194-934(+)
MNNVVPSPFQSRRIRSSLSFFEGPFHGFRQGILGFLLGQPVLGPIDVLIAIAIAIGIDVQDGNIVLVSVVGVALIGIGNVRLSQGMGEPFLILHLRKDGLDLVAEGAPLLGVERHYNAVASIIVVAIVAIVGRVYGARDTGQETAAVNKGSSGNHGGGTRTGTVDQTVIDAAVDIAHWRSCTCKRPYTCGLPKRQRRRREHRYRNGSNQNYQNPINNSRRRRCCRLSTNPSACNSCCCCCCWHLSS